MSLSSGLVGGAQGAGKKMNRRQRGALLLKERDAAEAKAAYARADAWAKSPAGTKYGEVPK